MFWWYKLQRKPKKNLLEAVCTGELNAGPEYVVVESSANVA